MPAIYGSGARPQVPALQADAVLAQANPVSGTKYTVLATTANVRIIGAMAKVTWTVQPNPLELHFTIDGLTVKHAQGNPVTATNYFIEEWTDAAQNTQGMNTTNYAHYRAFSYECRSIKVEAETTGGTVSALDSRVKWSKW